MAKGMQALVKTEPGPGLAMMEVPIPEVGRRDCLVRVEATSICGTDLHIYRWDAWAASRLRPPLIVGHEFCGRVAAVGSDVTEVSVGDYVAGEGHLFCGRCYYCQTGQAHICAQGRIIGVDTDGCFAQYVRMPAANLWRLDDTVPPAIGAIHDPLGNAVHSVMAAGVSGASVAVVGCGPVGLCSIAVAKRAGASAVYGVDVNPYRLSLAQGLGADAVIRSDTDDPVESVKDLTGGLGAEVVLEMSGHPAGIRAAFEMLRKGGRIVLLGIPPGPVQADLTSWIIFKEARVLGINGRRIFETWHRMAELLRSGLDVSSVVTHRFSLSEFEQAFAVLAEGRCGKIVLVT
ncbi:MAG: L-threonine 3-dehydrogenase [Firmicutes bacterium ZCTH02-B6]|nr:MAG: L-threonine 3-dehydrogenase [Firmicutes bacterium ZCTH02-B6]